MGFIYRLTERNAFFIGSMFTLFVHLIYRDERELNEQINHKKIMDMTNSNSNNKPQDTEIVHLPIIEVNDGMRKPNDTYQQWGTRRAGMTNASPVALQPALNSVVQDIQLLQAKDADTQEQYKAGLQAQIDSIENNISATNGKIADHSNKINSLNDAIQELKQRKPLHLGSLHPFLNNTR